MPKDLAALLVEDGAVPAEVMERALARQREAGGTLDTALLEEGAIAEGPLLGFLARAAELPPAPGSAWSASDGRARRVFPSRVAERHGLAPFALDGRELALVATYPVDVALLDEISFMLSLHLTAHVGPEWRVRELIHRLYGTPLPPRLATLAVAAGARPELAAPEAAPAPAQTPAPERPPPAIRFGRDDAEPLEPLAAALAQALDSVESFAFEDAASEPGEQEGGPETGEAAEDEGDDEPPAPDRTAPPRWTLDAARAALAEARHRDEVVVVALRYARDFFEFAAMFAVTRDAVAGHDALGAEEARERARSVAIWSSDPGIFRTVIETQSPYLGPVAAGAAGTDAVLHGLGRTPRTVLVYPVLLRDRPVCILYADNGEAPVSARRLGDLLLFLSTVGPSFERIIRARKKRRRRTPPPSDATAVEPVPSGAGAAPEPPQPSPSPGEPDASQPPGAAADPALAQRPAPAEVPPDAAPRAEPGEGERRDEPSAAAGARPEDWPLPMEEAPPPARAAGAGDPEPPPAPAADEADSLAALEARFFGDRSVAQVEAPPAATEPAPAPARAPAAAVEPPPEAPVAPAPAAREATPLVLADHAVDPDPAVAVAACAALGRRRREPGMRPALEKLRRALLSGTARAPRAARAIGAVRDVEAIPLLIQVLETSEPETARMAADALADITLQRLGTDARRWLSWWKENRGRGRAEWLFSGLTAADRETRVAASVELSTAAPPPVPYSADMSAAEREKAARAWAGWWSRSGHVL